jgi:hypothetical protein
MELNLQLNTKSVFNRDMEVELTNQATGQKMTVKPYLDGKVIARNIEPGQWRAVVKHPNMLFPIYDRPIRVFPNRPTVVPIRIPENIFENTPIKDTPDADLGPVQARFDEAAAAAAGQANKMPGQPIYSDDWNNVAGTIADLARANRELSELVSPLGHDHPEIAAKIDEVQANMQRFYDLFGRSLAQLQRQVEQLALVRKVEAAAGAAGQVTPDQRSKLEAAVADLSVSWADPPAIYSQKKKRAGEVMTEVFAEIMATAPTPVQNEPVILETVQVLTAMAGERTASTYTMEIEAQHRITTRSSASPLQDALIGFNQKIRG